MDGQTKKEIVKMIQEISGRYSAYEVFSDWVAMTAIAIANSTKLNHDAVWQKREKHYLDLARKHTPEEVAKLCRMTGLLAEAFEECMTDILGEIYMESGCGSKTTGQFFTPFHLSLLTAEMGIPETVDESRPYIINEPSSGGGGMIIAAAKVLKDRGVNYQRCMEVTAQDLDWKGVYMTYVQLSLLGIRARVMQGNTLADVEGYPPERIFITPALAGMLP